MRILLCARTASVLLAMAWSACASAASFDCAKAKTPMERAICAKPALSKLDERMASTYQRALKALSAAGADALRASQRSWLRYVATMCVPPPGAEPARREQAPEACLKDELEQRVADLDMAGVRLGAYVLNRIDQYQTYLGDNPEHPHGLVAYHVGYPQIDGATPAVAAWNRAQLRSLPVRRTDEERPIDLDSSYSVGCANENLLSIVRTDYEYPHGFAHGSTSISIHSTLLAPEVRALRPADLFSADSGWRTKLPTMFWRAYQRTNADFDYKEAEEAVRAAALKESRWLLTPEGLEISFSTYEIGGYAPTPNPITLSWATLKPLLTKTGEPACRTGAGPG